MALNDLATLVAFEISTEFIVICSIVGGLILVSVIAIIGGFLHTRRERLLIHAERMKALELGRELPDDVQTARLKAVNQAEIAVEAASPPSKPVEPKSFAGQCYSTTTSVCCTGFVFAWLGSGFQGVAIAIAAATGAIGVAGMICGTILASKEAESRETPMLAHAKPRYDPEAV